MNLVNAHMKRNAGARRLVASLATAMFFLAACGSSTTTSSSHLPTGPVTMGVLSCFTGSLSSLGTAMLQGSQVAQKAINGGGGILGQQLVLQPVSATGGNAVLAFRPGLPARMACQ